MHMELLNQNTLKFAQAYHSIEATYQIVRQMQAMHAFSTPTLAQYAIK